MHSLASLRALLIDLDGVLWRGRDPLPGVAEFFAFLTERGLRFLLLSNNSTRTPAYYVERLAGMGVAVTPATILTSSLATARYLTHAYPHGARVFMIGEGGLTAALQGAGFKIVEDDADLVVSGLDRSLTFDKLRRAALAIRAGAGFIGTNPDKTFPSDEGIIPGAGAILAALEAAVGRPPDRVVGKPAATMYEIALETLGLVRTQVGMLGDRLDTDIAGAQAAGMPSILVLTGVTTRAELTAASHQPDWVFPSLRELVEAWRQDFARDHG